MLEEQWCKNTLSPGLAGDSHPKGTELWEQKKLTQWVSCAEVVTYLRPQVLELRMRCAQSLIFVLATGINLQPSLISKLP